MAQRRLYVRLADEQHALLRRTAEARNTSMSALVRESIDRALPPCGDERERALARILDAPPMPVGTPSALIDEINRLRSRRDQL